MGPSSCILSGILAFAFTDEPQKAVSSNADMPGVNGDAWLALRFAGQQAGHAGLLVPPSATGTQDVSSAFRVGIFCHDRAELGRHLRQIGNEHVLFSGAAALVRKAEPIFVDYPPELVVAIEDDVEGADARPVATSYRDLGDLVVFKIRRQAQSLAGIAIKAPTGAPASADAILRTAHLLRDLRDVQIWRAQGVAVTIPLGASPVPFATHYNHDELKKAALDRSVPLQPPEDRRTWVAVRFKGQTVQQGGMLIPPRADQPRDADWAFFCGIFCAGKADLRHEIARIGLANVLTTDAARAVSQREPVFEDYDLDLVSLLNERENATELGRAKADVVPQDVILLKLRGQNRSTAGLAINAWISHRWDPDALCAGALFVRDIRDVEVWRAQGRTVNIARLDRARHSAITTYYSDEDLKPLSLER